MRLLALTVTWSGLNQPSANSIKMEQFLERNNKCTSVHTPGDFRSGESQKTFPLHWSFSACRTISKSKICFLKDHKHSEYCSKLSWRHSRHSSCLQIITIILLLKWAGKVLHWSKLQLVETYFWRFPGITWCIGATCETEQKPIRYGVNIASSTVAQKWISFVNPVIIEFLLFSFKFYGDENEFSCSNIRTL